MRLLLVAYHFGPGSATGGLRWNAMTRHLAEVGWTVDVVAGPTPRTTGGNAAPYTFAPGITVYTVADPEWPSRASAALHRLGRAVRRRRPPPAAGAEPSAVRPEDVRMGRWGMGQGWVVGLARDIDAARIAATSLGWARRAARAALALGRLQRYAATIVSTPPHLVQTAGPRIARGLGIPYLADLRDPLVLTMPGVRRFDRAVDVRLERSALRAAHTVICNTPRYQEALANTRALGSARLATIPNGYDKLEQVLLPDLERFRIAFAGWLYPLMDPRPFFEACGRLRAHHNLDASVFEITFMGVDPVFGGVSLQGLAAAYGLGDHFHLVPRGGRDDALRMQMSAAVLPVFDYLQPYSVTTKFYDHVQMHGSLLLMGHRDGALGDAARQVNVPVCPPGDVGAIHEVIEAAYARWCARDYAGPTDRHGTFDRKLQSARLDALLRASLATSRIET